VWTSVSGLAVAGADNALSASRRVNVRPLGVGPDEAPIEHGADCLLIALAETGDESRMRFARRLLVVNRSGAADHQRARGQDRDRNGRDHEATHDMLPAARA
jgi:hypothetical protein